MADKSGDRADRDHPLDDRRLATGGQAGDISLDPCPFAERIALRADEAAAAAIGAALGLELPKQPKTSSTAGAIKVLWLGPDEWLLIAEAGAGPETEASAGLNEKLAALDAGPFSGVDISHRNTAITVSGDKAAATLNAGCPQDLSLAAFPVGACSRTILGKSEIVLLREAEDRFRVECWRSFSDYVWKYLVDAAKSA